MRQCLNPDCLRPNPDDSQFCQQCGSKLLLVERYWAKSILGEGGFGRTFLAVDELRPSKPPCVIKQFLPQAQGTASVQKASDLFAQEAQRLEELGKHSQIPDLLAYFTHENRQYLVQEFIDGRTLNEELKTEGIYTENEIIELLKDILGILQFIHQNQIIHRDISPDNIIRRKTDCKLVLVDFGAAKYIEPVHRSVTGTIIGKAAYCAPEQAKGKPGVVSDLYSLGVTCLHLLTGVEPLELFDDWNGEWIWRDYLKDNIVSDCLGKIIDKLIEPRPRHRYQSVEEVLQDLQLEFHSNVTNIRYQSLEKLLAEEAWREADKETKNIMLEIAEKVEAGWLDEASINKISCEDLKAIDELWLKYSRGRFGFSVQKYIYQDLRKNQASSSATWNQLGTTIGWKVNNSWLPYSVLNFDSPAKVGKLPAAYCRGKSMKNTFIALTARLVKCNIVFSAVTSRYTYLYELLIARKWREADEETEKVMLQIVDREKEGYLDGNSINKLPCEDLQVIDYLWIKYSQGHFGFSVQKRIYQSLGGTQDFNDVVLNKFLNRVKWQRQSKKMYQGLTYNLTAPEGHLPAPWRGKYTQYGMTGWGVDKVKFFSRLDACQM